MHIKKTPSLKPWARQKERKQEKNWFSRKLTLVVLFASFTAGPFFLSLFIFACRF